MDNRVIELAEKIYSERIHFSTRVPDPIIKDGEFIKDEDGSLLMESDEFVITECLRHQAEESIMAAQVFYDVKKKKMMEVKEGER